MITVRKGDFVLTEKDFRRAERFDRKQRINPLTLENMFRGGLYCLLSISENYPKQMAVYKELLERGLDNPEAILRDGNCVRDILSRTRWPNKKPEFFRGYSEAWLRSDLGRRLLEDVVDKKEEEFELRRMVVREIPGMWYKSASLWMNMMGYGNLVPVDIWVQRALDLMGFRNIRVSDYRSVSGLTLTEYLEYERLFSEVAEEFQVSPYMLQLSWWCKNTNNGVTDQLSLFEE